MSQKKRLTKASPQKSPQKDSSLKKGTRKKNPLLAVSEVKHIPKKELRSLRIGIVTALFNQDITLKLEEGAIEFLENQKALGVEIEVIAVRVPGAVEIPLACQKLLDKICDGVIACGVVIRGETSHYDYVCQSVTDGITRLMLDYKKPIGFGVLTTENEEQALSRAGGNFGNKGAEAAQVVVEMIGLLQDLERDI